MVSSTLAGTGWNATVLGDDWAAAVTRLRRELDGDIVVYGSRASRGAPMGSGWWTRCTSWSTRWCSAPAIGCSGRTQDKLPLRLVESRAFGDGVVGLVYAPSAANG